MLQVQIRSKGFACPRSSHCLELDHQCSLETSSTLVQWQALPSTDCIYEQRGNHQGTFDKRLGAFPPRCPFAAGSNEQIAGNWSAQLIQFDTFFRSIYGKCPLNPQNIATKSFSTDGSTENMESHCSKKSYLTQFPVFFQLCDIKMVRMCSLPPPQTRG